MDKNLIIGIAMIIIAFLLVFGLAFMLEIGIMYYEDYDLSGSDIINYNYKR